MVWDFTVVSTNAQGLRHEGNIGRKPAGGFRIVCLGDSVTFGYRVPLVFSEKPHDYAPDQLPYPLLLERQLRDANPGRQIEVVPMAVPAYTTYQGLNWLRRDIDFLKPDVVTVCFGWNDVCLRPVPDRLLMPVDWAHLTIRSLMSHSQALIHLSRWRHSEKARQSASNPPSIIPRVPQDEYVANLLKIGRLTRDRGAQPLLIAPVYRDALNNPPEAALIKQYRDALRAAAETSAIPYLVIQELTETNYPANDDLFGELIHPNYQGHQVMARELLKFFAAHETLRPLNVPQGR